MSLLLEAFERHCRDRAHQPALWSRGEGLKLSFAQLADRARERASRLDSEPGELVGVGTGNRAAFVELFLALRARGSVMVAVDASLPGAEKLALARRFGLRRLLHCDESLPGEPLDDGLWQASIDLDDTPAHAPDLALVKLTSGTTGQSLGLGLTEPALLAGIQQIGAGMQLHARDRVLVAIPLSHSYGFDNGVLSLAVLGTPLILEPSFFPQSLLRALAESEASFFPAVPPMVRALVESDWPQDLPLRQVISAGGPLTREFAESFLARSGRPVHQFYGSTETGGISFERRPLEPEAADTVGHPLPGVAIQLDAEGVVHVDSAANFSRYLGKEPRSARAVVLGDRAEWTAEGRLRLIGRVADLLNVAGRRVSTAAVETSLKAVSGVTDAAVVSIEDPVRGDRVVAFLVGHRHPIPRSRLPHGLASRDIRWIDQLPVSERGKLDRAKLRDWARER